MRVWAAARGARAPAGGPGAAYLLEVEEGGRAGHGVREHAAGVGQQEAARVRHGAQHGAAGGRPAAEAALRSLRVPRRVRAPCLPAPSRRLLLFLRAPPPRGARSEAWKGSDAPLPGAPLPGRGSSRERAREYGKRGYMRERTDEGERGRESVTLEPPEPCLQRVMRVRVRACARVCSGGGGGGPWRTPTSNGPARREEDPERGRDS